MERVAPQPSRQRGVVLIIAIVMLAVISLLAALSIRNATSGEAVSGNVRTTELATQSAEMALRFCEDQVVGHVKASFATLTSATFEVTASGTTERLKVLEAGTSSPYSVTATWDLNPSNVTFAVPAAQVNLTGTSTYKRVPECVAEHLPVVNAAKSAMDYTSTYRITARGFGPEVAADSTRGRPTGSEVWLQSTISVTLP